MNKKAKDLLFHYSIQRVFIEDSKITNEKVCDYSVQMIKQLTSNNKCMLLVTEELSPDVKYFIEEKNVETLDLLGANVS